MAKIEPYKEGQLVQTSLTGDEYVRILNVWHPPYDSPSYRVQGRKGAALLVRHGQIRKVAETPKER